MSNAIFRRVELAVLVAIVAVLAAVVLLHASGNEQRAPHSPSAKLGHEDAAPPPPAEIKRVETRPVRPGPLPAGAPGARAAH